MKPDCQQRNRYKAAWICASVGLLFFCAGCRIDMHVQPRYNPYDPSNFFADGQSSRMPVDGTFPRAELTTGPGELMYTGKLNGVQSEVFPFPITREDLARGQARYNIFCSPCHGMGGDGDGMIVQRGFRNPPSLHEDRLRAAPVGHFFDVMTNGFGIMYPYGYRVPPRDRWAIAAYIRALQLSRQVPIDQLSEQERQKLQGK